MLLRQCFAICVNRLQLLVTKHNNEEASNQFALAYERVKSSLEEAKEDGAIDVDLKAVAERMECGDEQWLYVNCVRAICSSSADAKQGCPSSESYLL